MTWTGTSLTDVSWLTWTYGIQSSDWAGNSKKIKNFIWIACTKDTMGWDYSCTSSGWIWTSGRLLQGNNPI